MKKQKEERPANDLGSKKKKKTTKKKKDASWEN